MSTAVWLSANVVNISPALDDRPNQRLEVGAIDMSSVPRAGRWIGHDEVGFLSIGEIPLGLDDRLPHRLYVFGRRRSAHFGQHLTRQQDVDVVAAEMRVS